MRRDPGNCILVLAMTIAANAWGQAATSPPNGDPAIATTYAIGSEACERARRTAIEHGDFSGKPRCVPGATDQRRADTEASVDIESRFRNPPRYPKAAIDENRSGRTVVLVTVDEQGMPTGFSIDQSSGSADIDEAALTAARRWRYRPAIRDGRPQPGEVRVPLNFSPN